MVPDFQSLRLPLLKLLGDDNTHKVSHLIPKLANELGLSESERNEMFPSGTQFKLDNRVYWAASYLKHTDLLSYPQKGYLRITDAGKKVLKNPPDKINIKYLGNFEPFKEWQALIKANKLTKNDSESAGQSDNEEITLTTETPDEKIENSYSELTSMLKTELIEKIKSCSPKFFERLVVDLLLKIGYGGSQAEAGEVISKSNDGGIDGIIKEDRLGLDTIYIQAKKWENMVQISQVRDFAGALLAKKAKKGIFITTSSFPDSARQFVASIDPRIVLIDGEQLAELMIEHDLGESVKRTYQIKKPDTDYYEE